MDNPATKCGYCGFILRGSCGIILDHDCFAAYNEDTDIISVDENAIVTMRKRLETEVVQHSKAGAEQRVSTHSTHTLTQDELLIELVRVRRALWDHSIPTSERTKLKKDNLWQEIVNAFSESLTLETVKQRWKHLRDSYMKAKKKMRGYIRSGSGAESGHPLKSSFYHYEQMRFLDNIEKIAPTASSIQHFLEMPSSHNDVQMDTMQDDNFDSFDDSIMDSAYPPSETSQTSSCSSARAKKNNVQKQTEIEKKFLSMIDEELSQKKRDAVDSYLEQLGDILRRLPYIRRRNLQRKMLDIAIEEEDAMFAERENAN
ncbi:uncharacterized protein LOC114930370 isoform X1 [Nylanderia fulva]|uniref:uncharacterized protein LOC114930370 isoform X1 n=2 Tax=Nylanderia fulva TaxID=613905 RepID=UPI0010FAFCB5|nr:uncharacterized protein LOC114930370 isoform X1 [Nylanderia fulva]